MQRESMIRIGATFAGLAVAGGAFGAHLLEGRLPENDLQIFATAVRYQMFHALALLVCAALASSPSRRHSLAALGFTWGTAIFSGSLYLLLLTDQRWFGAITPIGGLLLILGWVALVSSARITTPRRSTAPD